MLKILKYGESPESEIFARSAAARDVSADVAAIIDNVAKNGEAALREYSIKFDGYVPAYLEVTRDELNAAYAAAEPELLAALREAAANIREFHEKQLREGFELRRENGVVIGQRVTPIERVGVYVPGGTAAYPSTVLMNVIPAKIAGCSEIIVATPPGRDGNPNPAILAAAVIAGADRVFRIGGAQAIAALALGAGSVPRVDKITGPGNAYVAEAKRQVFGRVSIDMIAGPSEILVVADDSADAKNIAADLLSQAEHDALASSVLVTDSESLANSVREQLEIQLNDLPRAEIARAAIMNGGKIILAENISEAVSLSNRLAPEHLELYVRDPFKWLAEVKNAGSVFLGPHTPEPVGDYLAGPNHTLPTSGAARFSSPLSVDDFIKKTQYIYYPYSALKAAAPSITKIATQEGLTAHAQAIEIRVNDK